MSKFCPAFKLKEHEEGENGVKIRELREELGHRLMRYSTVHACSSLAYACIVKRSPRSLIKKERKKLVADFSPNRIASLKVDPHLGPQFTNFMGRIGIFWGVSRLSRYWLENQFVSSPFFFSVPIWFTSWITSLRNATFSRVHYSVSNFFILSWPFRSN